MKKIVKNILLNLFVLMLMFSVFMPFAVSAQAPNAGTGVSGGNSGTGSSPSTPPGKCVPGRLCNPLKVDNLIDFWREILKIAAQIGSIFVVVGFVYTGFLFVKARGNAEELALAKRSFVYTVIGAAIVLGAWAFALAIADTVRNITS